MSNIHRHPDVSMAAKVGDPTLVDPKQTDAPAMIRSMNDAAKSAGDEAAAKEHKVAIETLKDGKVPESQPTPRSPDGSSPDPAATPKKAPPQVNEAAEQDTAATTDQGSTTTSSADAAKSDDQSAKPDDKAAKSDDKKDPNESSSKDRKKKKGLRKLIPF